MIFRAQWTSPSESRASFRSNPSAGAVAETKLVPCWLVGMRDPDCATEFIQDLAGRLANRVQLTTDGLKMYLTAVSDSFGENIDYAMLIKVYGNDPEAEKRYSPASLHSLQERGQDRRP